MLNDSDQYTSTIRSKTTSAELVLTPPNPATSAGKRIIIVMKAKDGERKEEEDRG
jgi:hypothetical protein